MEEKGLFLREKIKLLLYSMFIKHRAYDKLKYIYIANLFTKHWAYKKIWYVYWNHILFSVLSKISNGNAILWNDGEKTWNDAHDSTSEIDFCFIYPDLVIFLEAESNLYFCIWNRLKEIDSELQEVWKHCLLKVIASGKAVSYRKSIAA